MSVISNNQLAGSSGQGGADPVSIDKSLRFNSGDSAYLTKTLSAGNRKTWTLSFWVKLCGSTGHLISAGNDAFQIELRSDGQYLIANTGCFGNTYSTAVFRDHSAWQHFVIEHDATNTYCKIHVNGALQKTITASNADGAFNNNTPHNFNGRSTSLDSFTDFYLADVHFIDGEALAPTYFGEFDSNNVWQPKSTEDINSGLPTPATPTGPNKTQNWNSMWTGTSYNSTYSTDHVHDTSIVAVGQNTLSTNSALPANNSSLVFTPATPITVNTSVVLRGADGGGAGADKLFVINAGRTDEVAFYQKPAGSGVQDMTATAAQVGGKIYSITLNGRGAGGGNSAYLTDIFVDGRHLQTGGPIADFNTFNLKFDQTDLGKDSSEYGNDWTANNLTVPNDAAKGGFDTVTWTANGSNQSITGLNFQPDLVWAKCRNTGPTPHLLVDSVRGVSQSLSSHATSAEEDYSGISGVISAFNSDGFDTGGNSDIATSGRTFIAWCWKAGGTASSNTDGSITSSVSANSTYGFSIVSYTGNGNAATIGHGLNSTPKLIIKKFRSASSSWDVYHASAGSGKRLVLNEANAVATTSSYASVNSSTFDVHAGNNDSGETAVAYCWSEVPGFSKFGSYSGTGVENFIETGFQPAFVMIKSSNTSGAWHILDSGRDPSNPVDNSLVANLSNAESSHPDVDFVSNGFTLKADTSGYSNYSGFDYVYAAFAESPDGKDVDALTDTPTENFATLNPLDAGSSMTLSNGNLQFQDSGSNWSTVRGSIGVSSGKWYWECQRFTNVGVTHFIGIAKNNASLTNALGTDANSYGIYSLNGNLYYNNNATSYAAGTGTQTIGIALDLDAGTLTYYYNGVSQGTAVTGLSGEWFPAFSAKSDGNGAVNFGQRAFAYTPPTGFNALSTENLPTPTIAKGSTAMDVALYTGNGSTQAITGINHAPDFVWIKSRSNGNYNHMLFDSVRGPAASLSSNSTAAEGSPNAYGKLNSFDSSGFTVAPGTSDATNVNASSETYVGWTWDAGTSTVSNTDGSVTSSVRANPSAGFSIVNYTGTGSGITVGHGLNSTPVLYIQKDRDATESWRVYTTVIDGSLDYLLLHDTSAKVDSSYTAPTSSVFNIGGPNNDDHIVYCFAPVEGFSAFGTYTGNGSVDGPFVYTGFRVKWLLIKRDGTGDWRIWDTSRDPVNVADNKLYPNNSNAETGSIDTNEVDVLSNGFKLRSSVSEGNFSGDTYVYAAFASHPFKYARAR